MLGSAKSLLIADSDKTVEDMLLVLDNKVKDFPRRFNEFCKRFPINTFFNYIDDKRKQKVAYVCHKERLFVIHRLISVCSDMHELMFLENPFYQSDLYRRNLELKSWLQIAVLSNRKLDIIKYIVTTLKVDPNHTDIYGYSVLHSLCQKEEFDKEEFNFLLHGMISNPEEPNLFMIKAEDGITALELACGDERKLNFIKENKNTSAIKLLTDIDEISAGLDDPYVVYVSLPKEKMWQSILQNNDKQRLIKYIKLSEFHVNYYLDPEKIEPIIRKLPDNGLGVLRYIKKHFIPTDYHSHIQLSHLIFEKLSKIPMADRDTETSFPNSLLFVALITGRYQLVPLLLRSCQFDILPYSMMICHLCNILSNVKDFSDQVKENIAATKEFCETFAVEAVNRTENKEAKNQKQLMIGYLNSKNKSLENYSIIDIAFKSDCRRFLNLRICQSALDQMWYGRLEKIWSSENVKIALMRIKMTIISPYFKFCLHSAAHVIFLLLFSYSLVNPFRRLIYETLAYCWIYSLGYLVEELRQFLYVYRKEGISAYMKDETNVLDISALLFMVLAIVTMIFTNILEDYQQSGATFWVIVLYSISLTLFFMRLLYLAYAFETFGPKLKMIGKMILKDLVPLLFIFLVFIVSFGITFQALILFANRVYQNQKYQGDLSSIFGSIVRRPTFTIFNAQYILEEIETVFLNKNTEMGVLYVLLILFSTVVNIMLINLLIALFSQTVAEIVQDSKLSWRSKRYKLISEFRQRSFAPSPFNLVVIPFETLFMLTRCSKSTPIPTTSFNNTLASSTKTTDTVEFANNRKSPKASIRRALSMKSNPAKSNAEDNNEFIHTGSFQSFQTSEYFINKESFDERILNSLSKDIFNHFSFCVLQAFGMRDFRHVMVTSNEERQYQRDMELIMLRADIKSMHARLVGLHKTSLEGDHISEV